MDLGASYVGPTQNHILRLSRQLGIKTYKTFSDLKAIHFFQVKPNDLKKKEETGLEQEKEMYNL